MGIRSQVTPRRATRPGSGDTSRSQVPIVRGGLVEVLVVVTILGVLSSLVVAGVVGMKERVSRIACDADISSVALAADSYFAKHLAFPPTLQALYDERYLTEPTSPDHLVQYRLEGTGYVVTGQTSGGQPCRAATS